MTLPMDISDHYICGEEYQIICETGEGSYIEYEANTGIGDIVSSAESLKVTVKVSGYTDGVCELAEVDASGVDVKTREGLGNGMNPEHNWDFCVFTEEVRQMINEEVIDRYVIRDDEGNVVKEYTVEQVDGDEVPEEDILSKNLSKEGVALVFSFQEEVKSESDFFLSLQALATIRANLIEKLHKVFGSPVRSNAYLLSPKNGVIILSVDVLKGALLASKLPLEEGFILNSLDEKSYQEGLLDIHDQNLSRLSDQRETVRQMLQFRDFEIEPGEFFFTGKDFSKEELKEALKKIDFVKALNAKLI